MTLVFLTCLLLTFLVLVKAQSLLENFKCSLKTEKKIYLITSGSSRKNSRSVDQINNKKKYKNSLDNLGSRNAFCVGFLDLVVESTNVSALCPNATTALEINENSVLLHTVVNTSEDLGSGRTKSHLSFCLTSQTFLANLSGSLPAEFTFSYKIEDPENSKCHQICYFPGVLAIPDLPPQLQLAAEAQGQFIKAYQPDADSVIASLEESSVLVNRTSKFNVTCECLKLVVGLKSLNTIFENEIIPMEPFALTSLSLTLVSANVWVAIYQNSSLVDFNRASLFPNSNNVISGFSASGLPVVSNFSVEEKQLVSQLCFDSVRDLYSKAFNWDDMQVGLYGVKVFYIFGGMVTTGGPQPKDVEQTFTVVFHDLVNHFETPCQPWTVPPCYIVPVDVSGINLVLLVLNCFAFLFTYWLLVLLRHRYKSGVLNNGS